MKDEDAAILVPLRKAKPSRRTGAPRYHCRVQGTTWYLSVAAASSSSPSSFFFLLLFSSFFSVQVRTIIPTGRLRWLDWPTFTALALNLVLLEVSDFLVRGLHGNRSRYRYWGKSQAGVKNWSTRSHRGSSEVSKSTTRWVKKDVQAVGLSVVHTRLQQQASRPSHTAAIRWGREGGGGGRRRRLGLLPLSTRFLFVAAAAAASLLLYYIGTGGPCNAVIPLYIWPPTYRETHDESGPVHTRALSLPAYPTPRRLRIYNCWNGDVELSDVSMQKLEALRCFILFREHIYLGSYGQRLACIVGTTMLTTI